MKSLPGAGGREPRLPIKARGSMLRFVELDLMSGRRARGAHRNMSTQIDLLVFYRPLQPIDDDIGAPSSLAVHADRDVLAAYCATECSAVELAAMVRWATPDQQLPYYSCEI
jgi:hypothetical protein